MEMTQVHNNGYVRFIRAEGTDLDVVNSAKVSYNKEATSLGEKEIRLINFLAREHHTSPFRHSSLVFEVYCPLMVARQWWKHHVASSYVDEQDGWNESSRRYITEPCEFYVPDVWRSAPANSKQGSGEPVCDEKQMYYTEEYFKHIENSVLLYEQALADDVCAEQARLFLPANGMMVRIRWKVGLQAVTHFLNLRVAKDSQKEIQDYARAIEHYVERSFPISYQALKTGGQENDN